MDLNPNFEYIISAYFLIRFNKDEDEKQVKKDEFRDKLFPTFLNTSERMLRANGGEYFTGKVT